MTDKDLYSGLIRLHILHHAAHAPVFGMGIMEEMKHHGYEISAGTLYPMLHSMEKKQYLVSHTEKGDRRERRMYTITASGRTALAEARQKVKELYGELIEGKEPEGSHLNPDPLPRHDHPPVTSSSKRKTRKT